MSKRLSDALFSHLHQEAPNVGPILASVLFGFKEDAPDFSTFVINNVWDILYGCVKRTFPKCV